MAEIAMPSTAVGAIKNATNWKFLLFVLVAAVIVIFVLGKLSRQTIEIKDANGNVTGTGEITRSAKKFNFTAGVNPVPV